MRTHTSQFDRPHFLPTRADRTEKKENCWGFFDAFDGIPAQHWWLGQCLGSTCATRGRSLVGRIKFRIIFMALAGWELESCLFLYVLWGGGVFQGLFCFRNFSIEPPLSPRVMGCGAAEVTGLGFVCFVVMTPCVLSASRIDYGLFRFHNIFNFTPPPRRQPPSDLPEMSQPPSSPTVGGGGSFANAYPTELTLGFFLLLYLLNFQIYFLFTYSL